MRWDLFCHVVDNFGDVGVCWRLAADLAARGEQVRLWLDEPGALAWMAPRGAPGVEVRPWTPATPDEAPGDVVIEAFGCDPPDRFVDRMAQTAWPPVWINLEYLSAESYVERSHGLPSPRLADPGRGLTKWFFYPGFNAATGGLIREPGLAAERAAFDREAWLAAHGIVRRPQERVVPLFCYAGAPVQALLDALSGPGDPPALVLPCPGAAQAAASACAVPPGVRLQPMSWLTQTDFDRLLWSGDLNFVRGEDSFVRAMWAGRPFVWHIYPQHDGAHVAKLAAFLQAFGAEDVPGLVDTWRVWNGLQPGPLRWPEATAWQRASERWQAVQESRRDLASLLLDFVHARRGASAAPTSEAAC